VLVSVAAVHGRPAVIDRRRVELVEPGLPNQPYEHDTRGMDSARAEELVAEVRESALRCAGRALARLRSSLGTEREILGVALREPALPRLPATVAEAHASNHMIARADSVLYHGAVCQAASELGIGVDLIPRGEESRRAADALKIPADRLERWLAGLRASLGPPWDKDYRDAAARAIAALGRRRKLTLR
jgi:hypothetical protein